jgi:hypothetical protein
MQGIDDRVRGLLRDLLDSACLSHREVEADDDRLWIHLEELDLVSMFAFLSALQGTGCRAGVSAVTGPFGAGDVRLTVILPDGWWRS